MKKLYLIIIALVGIAAIGAFSFTLLHTQQNISEYNGFEIVDLKDSYMQGDLVTISVKYDGKKFDCHAPKIEVTNKTNSSQVFASDNQGRSKNGECPNSWWLSFYSGFTYVNGQFIPIEHSQSYIASVTLGGETIQKEFIVYPDPNHRFYTDIQISDLRNTYQSGIPIDFTVTVKGFGIFDVGPMPEVFVEDSNSNLIWSYQNHIVLCCPAELTELNKELQISRFEEPLIIEKPGTYTVHVTYDNKTSVKRFTVIDSDSKNRDDSLYVLEILDLQGNYMPNKEIQFFVHEKGFDVRCFSVYAEIYDSSGNKIWENGQVSTCPPGLGKSSFDNKIPLPEIKIGKSGEYQLVVESRGHEIVRSFSVLDPNQVR